MAGADDEVARVDADAGADDRHVDRLDLAAGDGRLETGPVEVADDDVETPKPLWQRLASLVIPIGFVLYILVSALANRDAG